MVSSFVYIFVWGASQKPYHCWLQCSQRSHPSLRYNLGSGSQGITIRGSGSQGITIRGCTYGLVAYRDCWVFVWRHCDLSRLGSVLLPRSRPVCLDFNLGATPCEWHKLINSVMQKSTMVYFFIPETFISTWISTLENKTIVTGKLQSAGITQETEAYKWNVSPMELVCPLQTQRGGAISTVHSRYTMLFLSDNQRETTCLSLRRNCG